jgi:hypothetical protein
MINMIKQPWFWIVIVIIVILILLLIWYFASTPIAKPLTGSESGYTTPPTTKTYPGTTVYLNLDPDKTKQLAAILKNEDQKIQKVIEGKSSDKMGEIKKIRQADEAEVKKFLTPEQYQRLFLAEQEHDSEILTP